MSELNPTKLANLRMLEFAALKLGPLSEQMVFLGGCTTALFITDNAAPDVRVTVDVDCIVDVASLQAYQKIEAGLIKQGFKQSMKDDVICRWRIDDLILDVMPTDKNILGFSNRWYPEAIQAKVSYPVSDTTVIYSVTAPYFLATKFEAFKGRGNKDYLASHDLEDIVSVLDGRPELVAEVQDIQGDLKKYLTEEIKLLLDNQQFLSALPGHLSTYGSIAYSRANILIERLQKMILKGLT